MFVQQLKYLKHSNLQDILTDISEKLTPKKFAGIIHDKDRNESNELVEPHVHIVLQFENARSMANLAKLIDQPQNCFEKWNGSVNNAYSYLVHHTTSVLNKHLYEPKEVIANFDYIELLEKIENHVNRHQKINDTTVINNYLDLLYAGQITKEEIEQQLTGSQYAKAKPKIEAVYIKSLEIRAEAWRQEMREKQEPVTVIWLFGQTGTGKTRLARHYANQYDQHYFITGSSRDPFQRYNMEHVVILDELRPNLFEYADLLKIFDPYNNQAMASSRYFDKPLVANVYIVTTPYSPSDFFNEMSKHGRINNTIDRASQLLRRIRVVAEVEEKEIIFYAFEPLLKVFVKDCERTIDNPFYTLDTVDNYHDTDISFQLLKALNEVRTTDENE
ncbi:Rep family protein [Streptococcus cuniculi]|uniref:Replication protein n=1 Tax=Streptococcus cuniculi TaxID=1432788 RepID=A0A4Y9JBY9_9STRE|nr:Rep family protein [Streptococcus cuniculi]MBF0778653.1 AAA family ATPase [Streptococcus cuniculi]TFU97434.1 replication protein [Streptococcus cuniculi]